jgi:hypothetical protein
MIFIIENSDYLLSDFINPDRPEGDENLVEYTRLWRMVSADAGALSQEEMCFMNAMNSLLTWQHHCNGIFVAHRLPLENPAVLLRGEDMVRLDEASQDVCARALSVALQCEEIIARYWNQGPSPSVSGSVAPVLDRDPPSRSQRETR